MEEDLAIYLHTCASNLVIETWIKAIKRLLCNMAKAWQVQRTKMDTETSFESNSNNYGSYESS